MGSFGRGGPTCPCHGTPWQEAQGPQAGAVWGTAGGSARDGARAGQQRLLGASPAPLRGQGSDSCSSPAPAATAPGSFPPTRAGKALL